jgi:hypothetical protein
VSRALKLSIEKYFAPKYQKCEVTRIWGNKNVISENVFLFFVFSIQNDDSAVNGIGTSPTLLDFHMFSNYVRKSRTAHVWCTCFSLCFKGLKIYALNHDITKLKVHHFTANVGSRFLIPVSNLYVVTNGCAVLFWKCKRYPSWHGTDKLLQITDNVRCQNCRSMALPWQQADSADLELNQVSNRTDWHSASFIS